MVNKKKKSVTSKAKTAKKTVVKKKLVASVKAKSPKKVVAKKKAVKSVANKAPAKRTLSVKAIKSIDSTKSAPVKKTEKCSKGMCKFTTFALGVVVGALIMWIAVSFATTDYGKNSSFRFFPIFRAVQTTQYKAPVTNFDASKVDSSGFVSIPRVIGN
jgi:membrane-associated HD superfamily phosphohydrolase